MQMYTLRPSRTPLAQLANGRTDRQSNGRTALTLRLTAIAIHFNEPGPIRSIGKGRSADKRISIMIQF